MHDGAIVANTGIIHPDSKWYKPGLPGYEYNNVTANEMLDELNFTDTDGNGIRNYPDGEDIEFVLLTDAEQVAEYIQDNLEDIGIKTEVKAMNSKELDPILNSCDFNIAISGHGGIVQPTTLKGPFFSYGTYQNDEYDELYQKQLKTTKEDVRMGYVGDLQAIIADDLPVYTLYHPKMWQVYKPDKLDTWFYTQNVKRKHYQGINSVAGTPYLTLLKDHVYGYTIRTGSYPAIIHETTYNATGGTITCVK